MTGYVVHIVNPCSHKLFHASRARIRAVFEELNRFRLALDTHHQVISVGNQQRWQQYSALGNHYVSRVLGGVYPTPSWCACGEDAV